MWTAGVGPGARRAPRTLVRLAASSILLAATIIALPPAPAVAVGNLLVPSAFPTIQGAIDAAAAGDTVVVAPGTYHEHIDFKGKAVEVRSSDGPASTTIDGDHVSHVVRFHSGEGRTSVLRGFTITHGLVAVTLMGGGVSIENASPTIVGNVVTDNDAGVHAGAGIGVDGGSPLIEQNRITGNHTATTGGGGGILAGGGAEVVGNVIEGNSAGGGGAVIVSGSARLAGNEIRGNHAGSYDGGGVSIQGGDAQVVQNLIVDNSADARGGGIAVDPGVGPGGLRRLVGNTIVANRAPAGSAVSGELAGILIVNNLIIGTVACSGSPVAAGTFHHNDVYAGGVAPYSACTAVDANLSADPHFVAPAAPTPDYRLTADSPAIDAGDNGVVAEPSDLGGSARVADGNGDGAAVIDLGAYEAPPVAARRPQMPYSVWMQPSGVPLDGIGSWVGVLTEPTAGTGQLPPAYLFGHYFGFVNGGGALGVIGLATGPTGKTAVLAVVAADGTPHISAVPFDWTAGALYYPLVYQTGPGSWGGWVLDYSANTWTHIGVLALPPAWGKLAPATVTAAPWFGRTAGTCAAFPRSDVLFYPPVGYVGATVGLATPRAAGAGAGECPPVISNVGPWARYQVGM